MINHLIVGVDPGKDGASAWQTDGGIIYACPNPESLVATADLFREIPDGRRVAYIEQVSGFIGVPHPGGRMFKFGQGFGWMEMVLFLNEFSINRVRPQEWQKAFALLSHKGETKPSHKRRICARARELHPGVKVTQNNCDAIMILRFGLEKMG